ncbi:formin domain containing protein [Acanthamoeba castellanii str. Neff]|uniref:Formin domain containing protein n=1 Tax=Acanthamoeba castellanii (strain ATCC 30010 / Neff) TaxID=1257118 RepID=L8GVK1_ACACF|nr:formin domain containing protein [Acanthamoeba castellanii str. Neff]ELR17045.1 formin domain containing protein [Acanthamoeba castellanii str. Neff]
MDHIERLHESKVKGLTRRLTQAENAYAEVNKKLNEMSEKARNLQTLRVKESLMKAMGGTSQSMPVTRELAASSMGLGLRDLKTTTTSPRVRRLHPAHQRHLAPRPRLARPRRPWPLGCLVLRRMALRHPAACPPAPQLPPKPVVKPSTKMKQLNWTKIPNNKVVSSYWKDVTEVGIEIDSNEVELLFAAREDKKEIMGPGDAGTKKKETNVTLLDPKRANNCAIALSRFKMSNEDIKQAILRLDESKLSAESVETLLNYIPTPEEIEQLTAYADDRSKLGKAEQYFLTAKDIKRLEPRLKAFLFKLRFPEMKDSIRPEIDAVLGACNEVKQSAKFKKVLEVVLALGNYLNGGSFRGSAYGFKLDVLNKLRDTKSADGETTLLHYLVKLVNSKYPEAVNWGRELKNSNLAQMNQGFKAVERELPFSSEDPSDPFLRQMTEFMFRKEDFDQLHADSKTMERGVAQPRYLISVWYETNCDSQEDFKQLADAFGESPQCTPDQLFSCITAFMDAYERAEKDMRMKEEKAIKMAAAATRKLSGSAPSGTSASSSPGLPGLAYGVKRSLQAWDSPRHQPFGKLRTSISRPVIDPLAARPQEPAVVPEFLSKLRKAPGSSVAPAAESAAAAGVEPSPSDGPAVSLLKRSLSLASFPEVGSTATALAEDSAKVVTPGTVRTRIGSFGGGSGILVATPEVTDVDSGRTDEAGNVGGLRESGNSSEPSFPAPGANFQDE